MFKALGMCEVYRVSEIASVLVDAVISLGKDNASRNWVKKVPSFNSLIPLTSSLFNVLSTLEVRLQTTESKCVYRLVLLTPERSGSRSYSLSTELWTQK